MNQIVTSQTGGMPLELDDLAFMYKGLIDAFKGIVHRHLDQNGCGILSGVKNDLPATISPNTIYLSEGYVMLAGEVCYFPYQEINLERPGGSLESVDNVYLRLAETFDPAGLDVFADGQTKNTYAVRRARAYFGPDAQPEVQWQSARRLDQAVLRDLEANDTEYVVGTFTNGFSAVSGRPVSLLKRQGVVYVKGQISGGTTNEAAFSLPQSWRPSGATVVPISLNISPFSGVAEIGADGTVNVFTEPQITVQTGFVLSFDGVSYRA